MLQKQQQKAQIKDNKAHFQAKELSAICDTGGMRGWLGKHRIKIHVFELAQCTFSPKAYYFQSKNYFTFQGTCPTAKPGWNLLIPRGILWMENLS